LLVLSKDAVARLSHSLNPERIPVEAPHVQTIAPAPAAKKEASLKGAAKATAKEKASVKKPAKPAVKKGKK
jgi:hypothetical protein